MYEFFKTQGRIILQGVLGVIHAFKTDFMGFVQSTYGSLG
ncbi:Putative protein [Zobellia galactanivorans]|uniref:Uncharacterized protein n=1 Tax=Zobellia galactanivorans (strain DSM 12802 / CCUG 47099 / CIP 106680 / NCIMB 13871 / Dsij) TaxID=63186 RepID=G0LB79_ZOBGA|nr:Putative protein [Zobellia galactanivorans]